jgi:DNA-binding transcriptional MerR regulator
VDRLTVGELSQASGLSPATIRRYGVAGILEPVHVDAHTGYRFYAADQVQTAVLARTLRSLDVPLDEIRLILAQPDPVQRLARLERHWSVVQQQVDRGRRERDHLARLFSGYQELIDSYTVSTEAVPECEALVRRRVVRLSEVPELTAESLRALRDRAEREKRTVLGDPVLRYGWPPERQDVDNAEAPRDVEVCLPVSGAGDVMLLGGTAATTEVHGEGTHFPQLLAAYGAVSQWARSHGRRVLGPALEWHRGQEHLEVGWLVTEPSEGVGR